jgi:hypothetical protein
MPSARSARAQPAHPLPPPSPPPCAAAQATRGPRCARAAACRARAGAPAASCGAASSARARESAQQPWRRPVSSATKTALRNRRTSVFMSQDEVSKEREELSLMRERIKQLRVGLGGAGHGANTPSLSPGRLGRAARRGGGQRQRRGRARRVRLAV